MTEIMDQFVGIGRNFDKNSNARLDFFNIWQRNQYEKVRYIICNQHRFGADRITSFQMKLLSSFFYKHIFLNIHIKQLVIIRYQISYIIF